MTLPRVSIVTTVYDRVDCLDRCLRAVAHLAYLDVEQIVVSDAPGAAIEAQVDELVAKAGPRVRHMRQSTRANDWGMTPAWAGAREAAGEYVCFLSDDNAYQPAHFGPLVAALDADPKVDFVYSSCLYAGQTILRMSPPRAGRIDLGQPLFRRSVLIVAFPGGLTFHEFAWDWRLIQCLLSRGVRWRHVDAPTFVFRLAAYPAIVEALA